MRCVQFYWTRGYFSKTKQRLQFNKTLCLALQHVENCRSRLSFFAFGYLVNLAQNLTAPERLLVQGNQVNLAAYTHEVPLYLCSIFCSCSQVRLSEQVILFGHALHQGNPWA